MEVKILETKELQDTLVKFIQTEKVCLFEMDGEIRLTPVTDSTGTCPFRGMFSDGKISVDRFIQNKQFEKELER